MTRDLLFSVFLAFFVVVTTVGCGGRGNTVATDSGEMTPEEYNKIQEEAAAKISESMKNQPSN
jgi:molybdenum-dependent DNA-binding transcriptional regulator ModE